MSERQSKCVQSVSLSRALRVPKNNRERDLVPRTQLLPLGVHRRGRGRARHGILASVTIADEVVESHADGTMAAAETASFTAALAAASAA